MITFGYKTKFSSIFRALAAIGIGLVMILGADTATSTVVKVVACFLFASGLVSFIYGVATEKKTGAFPLMAVNAGVDVIIGLLLFLNPGWVAGFIVSLIGIALIIFGALQVLVLSSAMSLIGAGFTSLILSIAAILGGIFLVFNPLSQKLMGIFAGCFLIVYGAQELISTWKVDKAVKEYEIRRTNEAAQTQEESAPSVPQAPVDAKEVEFEKVDEQ